MATRETQGRRLASLSQQRSVETRQRLLTCAKRLWWAQGYDETTVEEVCEAAGVSKGTFYFYFPSKEDLLIELGRADASRGWEAWEADAHSEQSTEVLLERVVRGQLQWASRAPKAILGRLVVESFKRVDQWPNFRPRKARGMHEVYTALFERGQQRGEIGDESSPEELAVQFEMLVLQGLLMSARGWKEPAEKLLLRRAHSFLHGVATKTPRASRSRSRR